MYYCVMTLHMCTEKKQPQHSCVQRVWDAAPQADLQKIRKQGPVYTACQRVKGGKATYQQASPFDSHKAACQG